MAEESVINWRVRSVLPLALFFAYVLAFIFEGPAFYSMMEHYGIDPAALVMAAVICECLGLLGGGLFVKNGRMAKSTMLVGMAVCFGFTCVFFFPPSALWMAAVAVCAIFSGVANSAWGYFLKTHTPPGQRLKSCADVLIYSNLLMILVNLVTIHLFPSAGLGLALIFILAAMAATVALPLESKADTGQSTPAEPPVSVKRPLAVLVIFVAVVTINAGLMYQIIVPAYDHLTGLTSWYWALPYVAALFVMRNLSTGRARFLYLGMGMIVGAFIFFLMLDRGVGSYLVVDTLILGACGIFDLFWWSILGEMLDLSKRPARVFGIGLAANVFGILLGKLSALLMNGLNLSASGITILALTVVCITLMLLPPLNHRLSMLLKNHAYLTAFSAMVSAEQQKVVNKVSFVESLTPREQDVLLQVLSGATNKIIAANLSVSENTIKTHLRNIYSKYEVNSRAELISIFLKS